MHSNVIIFIPLKNLSISLIPCIAVLLILYFWKDDVKNYIYAFIRMIGQLLILGYVLAFIFNTEKYWLVIICLCIMSSIASWISLRPVNVLRKKLFIYSFFSIFSAGICILLIITQLVLKIHPWFSPREIIPLGGMIFSSAMNSISLGCERFFSELKKNKDIISARNVAYKTSLIPITNMLFAVGVVSIPGVLTGQVLSGVSPLYAVRYQIMVLAMIFSSAGLSSAIFLKIISKKGYEGFKIINS